MPTTAPVNPMYPCSSTPGATHQSAHQGADHPANAHPAVGTAAARASPRAAPPQPAEEDGFAWTPTRPRTSRPGTQYRRNPKSDVSERSLLPKSTNSPSNWSIMDMDMRGGRRMLPRRGWAWNGRLRQLRGRLPRRRRCPRAGLAALRRRGLDFSLMSLHQQAGCSMNSKAGGTGEQKGDSDLGIYRQTTIGNRKGEWLRCCWIMDDINVFVSMALFLRLNCLLCYRWDHPFCFVLEFG